MKKSLIYSFFLFSFFMFFGAETSAQNMIYLKKKYTAKTHQVMMHDIISVKIKGEKQPIKGALTRIDDEGIMVDGYDLYFKDMEWIRAHQPFWKGMGRSLVSGSGLFLGVFIVNGAIGGYSPLLSQGNLIVIGSLVVVGVVLELISFKTYKQSKGWIYEPIIIPVE